jgi:hypothetical protein
MTREQKIQKAIDVFNFNPPHDDWCGRKIARQARRPLLVTGCDYEIVSVSGVQGMRIAA